MEGRPVRATTLRAIDAFEREGRAPGVAIDLGCGSGQDTVALLDAGWRVLAIDASEDGLARLRDRPRCAEGIASGQLEVRRQGFEEIELPPCDLLNASFSIPFCPPGFFVTLWSRLTNALPAGGRFAGQLFGDRHSWASIPDRSHQTRPEVERLFAGFILEHFQEEDRPSSHDTDPPMHWHMFHINALKTAPKQTGTHA